MGVVLIKWAWLKIFVHATRAFLLILQPHHSKHPRSAPGWGGERE